ncbi:hypothetical protein A7981_00885 [Methylovorus sp. MM2]|nr:hypothetical protein A7981_00885 [Methylovorus sp. MM2]
MRFFLILLCFMLMVDSQILSAAPAPWFLWQSKVNSKIICSQVRPGDGWYKLHGSFNNGRCQ